MASTQLSRDGIIDAAIEITRTEGLRAVTMRAVASRFEVTPMALYRHIADRDELVRGVADRIGALVQPVAAADASWQDRVRAWAMAERTVLRQHRGLAAWLMENGPAGEQAYRLLDLLAGALNSAGFEEAQIARGAALIMSWTFSRAAIEDNADTRREAARGGRARAFVAGLASVDPEVYPVAARVGKEFFLLPMDEIFTSGLDAIIAGLAIPSTTASR